MESVRADEARFRAFRCFFVIEAFSAQQKVCVLHIYINVCVLLTAVCFTVPLRTQEFARVLLPSLEFRDVTKYPPL